MEWGVGRKPSVDVEGVKELRDSGKGASAIAKELGIGRASVYRALQGCGQSRFWKMTFLDRIFSICAIVIQQDR